MGVVNPWRGLTLSEIGDELYPEGGDGVFTKPNFPTRRWGQVFTKTSTTCKMSVEKILKHYKEKGCTVRRVRDEFNTKKFKGNLGTFYSVEIKL